MPTVDVVVSCYNYGRYLEECVQSVLSQEGVDVSVIVIDDASTDDSASVAATLAENDFRVRLIVLSKNVGMIPAVNRGLQEASGEYFVKLDADDLLPSGSLQRSVALLERYADVGFVYGRPRHFTNGDPPRPRSGRPRWKVWPGEEWVALRCRLGVNCISQPEVMIRSSTLRTVGEFNPKLPHTSDVEMWLRLAMVSDVGRINGVDQGYYRVHAHSMQRTVNAGIMTDLVGRREAFASAFSSVGDRISGGADLQSLVRRKLAAEALDGACRAYDRDRVDPVLESKLVEFAFATYPGCATLPEWRRLQTRHGRGRRSRWAPGSLFSAAVRRGREEIAYFRWLRTGV